MKIWHQATGALIAVGILGLSPAAHAQNTVIVPPPPVVAPAGEQVRYVAPNIPLMTSGLVLFGVTYVPSVIVAAESPLSADHNLYIPLVGPWINLGNRPACGAAWISCDRETVNKALLVGDGILQGIGAITTVVGFLVPERMVVVGTTAQADKPSLHVTPVHFNNGAYGMAAFGNF